MKFIPAILIFLLSLQAFYPLAIYSYYFANKDFIATVLCINKEKPELQCNGKCYLNKELGKAKKEEKSKDWSFTKGVETIVYTAETDSAENTFHLNSLRTSYRPFKSDNYSYNFYSSCFHPPTAC